MPTALGGALFLVTLLRWLDLPAGWEAEPPLAAHLGGWALVEAFARALLGPAGVPLAADPLWAVLAELDGRSPGGAIGRGLPRASAFRLPVAWLRRWSLAEAEWVAGQRGARLWLRDARAGFLVADVPCCGRPWREVVQAEVEAYRAVGLNVHWWPGVPAPLLPLHPVAARALAPAACWWLARALGFVRWLLGRALGADESEADVRIADLLRRRGRVQCSRTHVDLALPLDEVSVPIRRAGLDCDPGWVPDLRRIVLFHYLEGGIDGR